MTAEFGNWPVPLVIAAAASVVIAPVAVPAAVVIVVLAVCWSLASLSLRNSWGDLPGSTRLLHLSVGALTASTFIVLTWSSFPVDDATNTAPSVLVLVGPLGVFVVFSLFRMLGSRRGSLDPCDVIDAVAVAVLPWSLVATVVAPWIVGPRSVELRMTVAAIVWVSAIVFVAGVLTVLARPDVGPIQPFLAVSAMSLGGLGWVACMLIATGSALEQLFPRVTLLPAVAYLVAVERGELVPARAGHREGARRLLASGAREQSRWVLFAAIGMGVAFLAIVERSMPLLFALAGIAGLSIARLAVASARIAAAGRMIGAFDDFLEPLALAVDEEDVVDRATVAARTLLGSDEVFVEVAGRPDLTPEFSGRPAVVNSAHGAAVISRLGDVQICTLDAIPPARLRALTRLADIVALALASVDRRNQVPDEPFAVAARAGRPRFGPGEAAGRTSQTSSPDLEIWVMVERDTVVAADPQAAALLGYDPINTDATRLVRAGNRGEPFRSESNGRWLQARVMAGDRPETTMIVVAPTTGQASSPRVDASSGLPNLHDFELQGSVSNAVVIVFYLHDLERVRDSVGSEAGDSFIRRLAVRARRTFREGEDIVWRGDGAKLIVLSPLGQSAAPGSGSGWLESARREAAVWVEDRRAALSAPTALGMSFIAPAISAGFTVVDEPLSPTEVLQQAEMALIDARDNHPRSTVPYSTELHARLSREWRIQSFLAAGLDDLAAAGFTVHYQPIIGVADGSVGMVEALARWDQPELGRVSPAEFIPIAEKAGVVGRIDDFVLARAVDDLKRFRAVAPDLAIQVNMSPSGLEPMRLAEVAKFVLRSLGADDPGITIEVTESALSNQPMGELNTAFSFLREANLGIAVDDFGTGESNFERMNKLPFTQVKLADQFVRSSDCLLMTNVVNVVHGMGMNCVVEGVETRAQYEIAVRSGADHVQGWHFAPAMPIAEALQYCEARLHNSDDDVATMAARPQRQRRRDDDQQTDERRRGDGGQRSAVAGDRSQ